MPETQEQQRQQQQAQQDQQDQQSQDYMDQQRLNEQQRRRLSDQQWAQDFDSSLRPSMLSQSSNSDQVVRLTSAYFDQVEQGLQQTQQQLFQTQQVLLQNLQQTAQQVNSARRIAEIAAIRSVRDEIVREVAQEVRRSRF